MVKFLPFLFLLSFACEAQELKYWIISDGAGGLKSYRPIKESSNIIYTSGHENVMIGAYSTMFPDTVKTEIYCSVGDSLFVMKGYKIEKIANAYGQIEVILLTRHKHPLRKNIIIWDYL